MSGRKKLWIGIAAAVLVIALIIVIILVIKPFGKGKNASGGNSDNGIKFNNKNENGSNAGQYITFGSYEQDNDPATGTEEIMWLVLKDEGDRILVVSKNVLDCKVYNKDYAKVSWADSTLRAWLNNDFYNTAFSDDEKAKIHNVDITYDDVATGGIGITQDSVFLLSDEEVSMYLKHESLRQCQPTDYAIAQGASVNVDNGRCWWWLRSSGDDSFYDAAGVQSDGEVDKNGFHISYSYAGVRPAMWIDKID